MPITRAPLTWKHVLQFPEDGCRHELLDGEHYMTPAPTYEHQSAVGRLFNVLCEYFRKTGTGEAIISPIDVVLSEHNLVQPDVVVLLDGGAARIEDGRIHGAPGIVVEVLSPATRERDLGLKRLAYQQAGIPAYWIVDLQARSISALALAGAVYETEVTALAGETFQPKALPGFELAVAELFEG